MLENGFREAAFQIAIMVFAASLITFEIGLLAFASREGEKSGRSPYDPIYQISLLSRFWKDSRLTKVLITSLICSVIFLVVALTILQ